jgi:cellulose synthase/poly-beta-1,6-N-acetylglucosamine synthase-like glycosyltransferase
VTPATLLGWAVAACYVYLLTVFTAFLAVLIVSSVELRERLRQAGTDDDGVWAASRFTIPVSVIAPVFNESVVVESAVRSLLDLNYRNVEIIVVNDGSSDGTLDVLRRAFDLEHRHTFYRRRFPCAPVRAVYDSRTCRNLIVVDKDNGGKADALNAGLNLARFRYICSVDGDTIYGRDALLHAMRPVLRDPASIVGVTSNITVTGRPEHEPTGAPAADDRLFMRFQLLDYIRAFLGSRLGWTRGNFMLCCAGAFSIWRRDVVVEAGGFSPAFTCEDIEFTFRVHERLRRERRSFRVIALPESVGRTEGPDTIRGLIGQRARWQRVILETVWHYRRMLLNRRYGSVGWAGMPLYLVVEVLAPVFELASIPITAAAWYLGMLDWRDFALILGAVALTHAAFTNAALLMDERTAHRYSLRTLLQFMVLGVLDLFVYRPVMIAAHGKGLVDFLRGRKSWDKAARNRRG